MSDASFLPDDYLAERAERRTNVISLTLFAVVMVAVFGAFLVTNRQWSQVKTARTAINVQYDEAAKKIEELNHLEAQKQKMLQKAELTTALVERVPRSILLAELINRMPPRLSLLEFTLKSTPEKVTATSPATTSGTRRLSSRNNAAAPEPERPRTREEAMQERKVEAPRYLVEVSMVGVAPTDLEVSRYIAELNAYRLVRDVTLKHSIQTDVDGQTMREFRVEMKLDPDADVRGIEPLYVPRNLRDPMTDELHFTPGGNTASVEPSSDGRN